jgi:hypothetical protein
MALSNHLLLKALDPEYAVECSARPQPPAEQTQALIDGFAASNRRLELEFASELAEAKWREKFPRSPTIWWPIFFA